MAGTSTDPRPDQDRPPSSELPLDRLSSPTIGENSGEAPGEPSTEPFGAASIGAAQYQNTQDAQDAQPVYSRPSIQEPEFDEKHHRPTRLDTLANDLHRTGSHPHSHNIKSPSSARADANRLDDDLALLRVEQRIASQEQLDASSATRSKSMRAVRNIDRQETSVEDTFNPPIPEPPPAPIHKKSDTPLLKFFAFLKKFPRFVRYIVYLIPGGALLLIPVLLGALAIDQDANPIGGLGGTQLMWFGIWLEIVWGSLWVSRMVSNIVPHIVFGIAKLLGSNSAKKWREVAQVLELHFAFFLWMLAMLVSFKPCNDDHRVSVPADRRDDVDVKWINIVFKVIIAFFVLAALNFVEKICLQWIAAAFHERTYATRIDNNKGDIRQLVKLFEHAKAHLSETDSFWHQSDRADMSGTQTPMRALHENARQVLGKVGQVAGKVGNDIMGRKTDTNQPKKIVSELLRNSSSAHTLARLIYRSLVREGEDMVYPDDMLSAFAVAEEADAAFNMFDKDLNGDISMDEFEAVTNEISMEKKAIAASLKDLDSVVKKLDKVFLFAIVIIVIIIFVSIISGSAAAGLASAGSAVLGLAWVLQATAQEFLQSIIFVFIKHPFDVGDRVTIYGSTGATLTGDDYYVTEISLLYTEFKKLQGHVVQAPNSLLNTLFILNQRRSNGLADPVPLQIRFGTPAWMIDELKARLLEFCANNKRDFQTTILVELSAITDTRSATLTVVFIHKSNFQNELLRLARHNRFMMELMRQMHDIGIQSPYRIDPGGSRDHPLYWAGPQYPPSYSSSNDQPPPQQPPPVADPVTNPVADPVANPEGGTSEPYQSMPHRPSVSSSARAGVQAEANLSSVVNVADVFENRRDHIQATRLASIREKERAAARGEEARRTSESESRPSASASGVQPPSIAGASLGSIARSRTNIFRPRSNSRHSAGPSDGTHIV
ncbi:mechanosensitive ion channel protein 4/5/6/7/8/9/10 [Geosmithia morbida]|uniref:Mechanosensitive ion channel protein n=1 Tax=Geosmithia morbida TaxID=1094350 RepID=A0A9P5D2F8_9HYPO|nr:mechanosensitive ion channel protein 4/5/6/7/8/9/10 [Geosmithia morbida]KAF4120770.1 mechanosensitive ion channel protein 4/5/6/7/8/9/10 [Geosmithia morbida]